MPAFWRFVRWRAAESGWRAELKCGECGLFVWLAPGEWMPFCPHCARWVRRHPE